MKRTAGTPTRERSPLVFLGRLLRSRDAGITIVLTLMVVMLSVITTSFLTYGNLYNISRNFSLVGISALGQTVVIITAGIDLSVGSVTALSGIVTALTLRSGASLFVGLAAGLATALAVGFINGFLIVRFRMPPFVITLGALSIARSLTLVLTQGRPVFSFGPDERLFLQLGGGQLFGIPNPVIFLVVLAILLSFALRRTVWGLHLYAVGGNEQAARVMGIAVGWVKISAYMFSSLMAGVVGILEVSWLSSVTANLALGRELSVIAATVIGGANLMGGEGGAFGAVVGAVLIEVIRNGLLLLGMNPFWQGTFVGLFIIFAVLLERLRGGERQG
jgi:ribose transport system permease protein